MALPDPLTQPDQIIRLDHHAAHEVYDQARFIPGLPFEAFEFIVAEFVEPDTDFRIFHTLKVEDPYRVFYIPVMKSHDCTLYDKRAEFGAAEWDRRSIVIRSNLAPVRVVLLLVVARDSLPRADVEQLRLARQE